MLHISAKLIVNEYNGIFPGVSFSLLKKTSRIGDYTAAAISSFALINQNAFVINGMF